MSRGDRRRIRMLLPNLQGIGVVELVANGKASVATLDGEYRIFNEVEARTYDAAGRGVDQTIYWLDDFGNIEKSLRPGLRLEMFRTDELEAIQPFADRATGDVRLLVPSERKSDAEPTKIALTVRRANTEPPDADAEPESETDAGGSPVIAPGVGQFVRPAADGVQVLLTFRQSAPPGFSGYQSPPQPADRERSERVDFDHKIVQRLADRVGDLNDSSTVITEMAALISTTLSLEPQSSRRSASAIIQSRSGGRLDHCVALTALLRQRGVATRVVFGLVATGRHAAMVAGDADRPSDAQADDALLPLILRSWVIAHDGDRWTMVDPVTGERDRGLRMSMRETSDLTGLEQDLEAVFRQLTELRVTWRGARYESDDSPE